MSELLHLPLENTAFEIETTLDCHIDSLQLLADMAASLGKQSLLPQLRLAERMNQLGEPAVRTRLFKVQDKALTETRVLRFFEACCFFASRFYPFSCSRSC
jgi:hypothetical protein